MNEKEKEDLEKLFIDPSRKAYFEEKLSLMATEVLFSLQHPTKQAKNVNLALREEKAKAILKELFANALKTT